MEPQAPHRARDHGGNLDQAIARFGGAMADWVDLSTGINPLPYPIPEISPDAWQALPRARDMAELCGIARQAYRATGAIAGFAGAQGAIQAIPYLRGKGAARILSPTYNEHEGALRAAAWQVTQVAGIAELAGADLGVVVNPNNPTGQVHPPAHLMDVAEQVGILVIDESFVDPTPDSSVAPMLERQENIVVLRSFGKFYGLAGIRLGFALGSAPLIARLKEIAGPWPVSGPAMEVAGAALQDSQWQAETITRLTRDAARLDSLAARAGLSLVGGTSLFRTYHAASAREVQEQLARSHIWSRIFPYSAHWIRLGLPGPETAWQRLARALQ